MLTPHISTHWRPTWVEMAQDNYFIGDRLNDVKQIEVCLTREELRSYFEHGNWATGQGFAYGDLCFIQQQNGGDEYWTIKQGVAFESISWGRVIKAGGFDDLLNRLVTASLEKCKSLDY